jgi:hypothetical protein
MIFCVPSIAEVVAGFKHKWTACLKPEVIQAVCREVNLSWRKRVLDPVRTVQLLLLQVLHGNTAISQLPHLSKLKFCPAAYCQARARLPVAVLEKLLERIRALLQDEDFQYGKWLGHRIFLVDGLACSMPDTPELEAHFGKQGRCRDGCGFPIAHLLALVHFSTGMVVKLLAHPLRTHDLTHVTELHPELTPGDLLVGDRAFCSYHHFCSLIRQGVHAVIRMHANLVADFTPGRKHVPPGEIPWNVNLPKSRWIQAFGKTDQLVEWFRPYAKPKRMTKEEWLALPKSIVVRELRYRILAPGFRTRSVTLVTTLTDATRYPVRKLAELYSWRWEIETNFNHLKTTMKMDVLRSKTVGGVLKELLAYCIVYNLVRLVMLQAAGQQRVSPKQISFVDALRWLMTASPGDALVRLLLVPHRPGRFEIRSKKRREKPYPYLILERLKLRNQQYQQLLAA